MFPGQVASLEPLLMDFLQAAFGGTRDDPAPLLRGVYFTSGTQEGTPIDRLTGTLARAFGVDQTRTPSLQPVQGRSYFLERLLKEVIFGEAMLVAHGPAADAAPTRAANSRLCRRGAAGRGNGRACCGRCAAPASARSTRPPQRSPATNRPRAACRSIRSPMTTWHGWRRCWTRRVRCRTAPTKPILAACRCCRSATSSMRRRAPCIAMRCEWALLPRLMWRLETQLRGNLNRADFLYEATRVYLMLGNAGPLDASLVREWMRLDWQTAYPGLGYAPLRDSLLQHLDALLAEPLPQMQLDGALVTAARARIAAVPLAQRVYSRIKPSAARAAPAAVAPERRARPSGPAAVRPCIGQAAHRRRPGLLHRRWLPQGAAAVARRRREERGIGKLGPGRPRGLRS